MDHSEWLKKALAKIDATPPGELYKQLFGFYEADYCKYLEDNQHNFEAQYVIDVMNKLGTKQINIYESDIQPPSKMFFHYLSQECESDVDPDFWDGWGADYIDVPGFPLRYLWVNGQGTVHFFQLKEEQ